MKKIFATSVIFSFAFVVGLSSIANATGPGNSPLDFLSNLFGRIENASQIETGGDYVQNLTSGVLIEYDEEQAAHVSITAASANLPIDGDVFVRVWLTDSTGYGVGTAVPMLDGTHGISTVEFDAKKWELTVTGGNGETDVGYAYSITYPPAD